MNRPVVAPERAAATNTISLTYWHKCPYKLGDEVTSPLTTPGTKIEFLGRGTVIAIKASGDNGGDWDEISYEVMVRITDEPLSKPGDDGETYAVTILEDWWTETGAGGAE